MSDKVEKQIEHFDKVAEKYFNMRMSDNYIKFYELLYEEVFNYMPEFPAEQIIQVLEVMCGSGNGKGIVEKHYKNKVDYTGFDYSQEMIRLTKEKFPDINIYRQDVTRFVADKKYDIVILLSGLHHVPEYVDQVLEQLKKSLKPEGVFLNYEPTYNNYIMKKMGEYIYWKNDLFDETTERRFSFKELNEAYLKAGFNIKHQFYAGLLGYILWSSPDAFPKLNIGGTEWVEKVFSVEKKFFNSLLARKFSCATVTICNLPKGKEDVSL